MLKLTHLVTEHWREMRYRHAHRAYIAIMNEGIDLQDFLDFVEAQRMLARCVQSKILGETVLALSSAEVRYLYGNRKTKDEFSKLILQTIHSPYVPSSSRSALYFTLTRLP
ncbi:hypothetical protein HZB00_03080 [Candidatus Woesearchaeota archaeon]|nr:hypothetical protein [Candidatus Woesearchaeota archaeon]